MARNDLPITHNFLLQEKEGKVVFQVPPLLYLCHNAALRLLCKSSFGLRAIWVWDSWFRHYLYIFG